LFQLTPALVNVFKPFQLMADLLNTLKSDQLTLGFGQHVKVIPIDTVLLNTPKSFQLIPTVDMREKNHSN